RLTFVLKRINRMKITGVLETCLYVDDLVAAEWFYTKVLGLEYYGRQAGRHVFLRCGQQMVLLFEPVASAGGSDVPPHGAHGPGHLAFAIAEHELARWRERLIDAGVVIEQEVTWPQGGQSLY